MARGFLSALLLAALGVGFSVSGVRGEPLDTATCGQLRGEQARMEQSGVRGNMEKGPQWAKANLTADKLDQIRRLMDLDEQLIFRCSSRNLVELPPDADTDPAAAKTDKEDKADRDDKQAASPKADAPAAQAKPGTAKATPAPPAKVPAGKPGQKEAAKTPPPAAKAAPAQKQEPAKTAAPSAEKAAAAKPKPKAKVDDAYKAPPANPNVDPFANQPARQ